MSNDTPMLGHSGVLRTYRQLAQQYYWPTIHRIACQYITACEVCPKVRYSSLSPVGIFQPLTIPSQVWEDISMDIIDGFPRSEGNTSLMVVVDQLTKFAHLIRLVHPYNARTVASKFVSHVMKLHGVPRSI